MTKENTVNLKLPLYSSKSDGILCIGRIKSASIGCPLHFSFNNCDVRKLQNFSLFFSFVSSSVFLSNAFSIQNSGQESHEIGRLGVKNGR